MVVCLFPQHSIHMHMDVHTDTHTFTICALIQMIADILTACLILGLCILSITFITKVYFFFYWWFFTICNVYQCEWPLSVTCHWVIMKFK